MALVTPEDARRIRRTVETVESQILSNNPSTGDRTYASLQALQKVRVTGDPFVTGETGQHYYPAFTQQNNPECSEWLDHGECWLTDPNQRPLAAGWYLAHESGSFLGLPALVPATAGVPETPPDIDPSPWDLTVAPDDLSPDVCLRVIKILLKHDQFKVTQIAPRTALIEERCRTVRPIAGPPPWTAPAGVCCNEDFTDGTFYGIFNCATGLFGYYCQCIPDHPPSGSGSGTGSGPDNCGTTDCAQCPDGMPRIFTFQQVNCVGAFADANGQWDIAWTAGCTLTQTRGLVTCTLDWDVSRGWWMKFVSGIYVETMAPFHNTFLCCGDTRFVQLPEREGGQNTDLGNHTDDFADLVPGGPCTPCGSGSGSGGGTSFGCCPGVAFPNELIGTFANGSVGSCASLNGTSFSVFRSGSGYAGSVTIDGVVSNIALACTLTGWTCSWIGSAAGQCHRELAYNLSGSDCSAIHLVFQSVGEDGAHCCSGIFDLIFNAA